MYLCFAGNSDSLDLLVAAFALAGPLTTADLGSMIGLGSMTRHTQHKSSLLLALCCCLMSK